MTQTTSTPDREDRGEPSGAPRTFRELIVAMALGLDDYDVQGLTLAQKELLADIVDDHHAACDRADGIDPGHPLAYEPEQRWWRSSSLPPTPLHRVC